MGNGGNLIQQLHAYQRAILTQSGQLEKCLAFLCWGGHLLMSCTKRCGERHWFYLERIERKRLMSRGLFSPSLGTKRRCWRSPQCSWPLAEFKYLGLVVILRDSRHSLAQRKAQNNYKTNAMCSSNKCNLATSEGSTRDVYEHIIQSTGNLWKWSERLGGLDDRVPAPSDGESSSRVTSSATSSATVSGSRPWVLMKAWACLHLLGCWEAKIARSMASPSWVATSV